MELSAHEKRVVARTLKPDSSLGTFGAFMVKVWSFVSFFIIWQTGGYLSLVCLYGFIRVHKEGLHFIQEPGNGSGIRDCIVSNGDHISYAEQCSSFPLFIAFWIALFLPGYLLIKWCSRRRKEAAYRKILDNIYDV
jgi:hypothetical protein